MSRQNSFMYTTYLWISNDETVLLGQFYFLLISLTEVAQIHASLLLMLLHFPPLMPLSPYFQSVIIFLQWSKNLHLILSHCLLSIHIPLQHFSSTFYYFLSQILSLPNSFFLSLLNFLILPFVFFFSVLFGWCLHSVSPSSFPPFIVSNNFEVDSSFFFHPLYCLYTLTLLLSPFSPSWFYLPCCLLCLWSSHIAEMSGYTLHLCVSEENSVLGNLIEFLGCQHTSHFNYHAFFHFHQRPCKLYHRLQKVQNQASTGHFWTLHLKLILTDSRRNINSVGQVCGVFQWIFSLWYHVQG